MKEPNLHQLSQHLVTSRKYDSVMVEVGKTYIIPNRPATYCSCFEEYSADNPLDVFTYPLEVHVDRIILDRTSDIVSIQSKIEGKWYGFSATSTNWIPQKEDLRYNPNASSIKFNNPMFYDFLKIGGKRLHKGSTIKINSTPKRYWCMDDGVTSPLKLDYPLEVKVLKVAYKSKRVYGFLGEVNGKEYGFSGLDGDTPWEYITTPEKVSIPVTRPGIDFTEVPVEWLPQKAKEPVSVITLKSNKIDFGGLI